MYAWLAEGTAMAGTAMALLAKRFAVLKSIWKI